MAGCGLGTARELTDRIQRARWQADLVAALRRYQACCDAAPLGQQIEVADQTPGLPALGFRLVTTSEVEMGRPLTAFPADAMVMELPRSRRRDWDGQTCRTTGLDGAAFAYRYFNDIGKFRGSGPALHLAVAAAGAGVPAPLTHDEATLKHHFRYCAAPVAGFAPACVIVTNTEGARPTPDKAAMWVEDVADVDPYDSLVQSDEAVPTFAQITVSYLNKIAALANVRVCAAPGRPTVLIAVRTIPKGEVLRTGRPPLYWIGSSSYTEKIYEHLKAQPAPSLPGDVLREMIFGDEDR